MFGSIVIIFIVILLTILIQNKKPNPAKIFDIYTLPGRWYYIKYIAMLTMLNLRKLSAKLKRPVPVENLEKFQPLSEHTKAFDAVFFQAVSRDGLSFCGGIERRHAAKINGLFYLFIPNLGLLESMNLPKTSLDADPESVLYMKEYSGGGLTFAPVEPMKKWRLSYDAKMRYHQNPNHIVNVKLEGSWTSTYPHFSQESDSDSKVLARAIAKEIWSREYFQTLKSAHQVHYEQMGYFKGILYVDDEKYQLQMDAMRDHSFGFKRDWSLLHRYAFHMFYLDDDTRISIGVVSYPCTSSHFEMGYVLTNKSLYPVESCDFLLYEMGENGTPPWDYGFSFTAGSVTYTAQVKILSEAVHFKGNDTEARLFERFLECNINGTKGRGISEWDYNNTK